MNMFMAAGRDVRQLDDLVEPLTAGFYVSLHWPECVHARTHALDTLRTMVASETLSMADLAVASIDQLHALTLDGLEKGTDSYAARFARRILFSLYHGNESEYAENGLKLLQDAWEVIFWTIAALNAESPQHPFLVSAGVFPPDDAERGNGLMLLINRLAGDSDSEAGVNP